MNIQFRENLFHFRKIIILESSSLGKILDKTTSLKNNLFAILNLFQAFVEI